METKFTKGQWKVGESITTVECDNDYIATCHHITEKWITEEQAIANAKLISAAPDLLEALERLTDYCILSGHIDLIVEKPYIQNALLAIQKATE